MQIKLLHPKATMEHLGYIPVWLRESDVKSAIEQLHSGYAFAGGWHKFDGFKLDHETMTLQYPGDPPMKPFAEILLHKEKIYMYQYGWVLVFKEDGTWEVCRMD